MKDSFFSVFQDERFMDLTLYQYGIEACRPLHSFGPFVRNHYLFHYILSGKGTLYANDAQSRSSVYELSRDTGFLIAPGLVNSYSADQEEPWTYAWLEFGGMRAKELLEQAGLSGSSPIYRPSSPENSSALSGHMLSIVEHPNASALCQIGHLYLFMDRLIAGSMTPLPRQGGCLREFYARETISFIEQSYSQSIGVADMALRCGLERSYFGKVFKEAVGQSPQEFLIRYRMSKAAQKLSLTELSVSEIGALVGYPNLLHFSRAFKNVYGVSPREYRQKNRLLNIQKNL